MYSQEFFVFMVQVFFQAFGFKKSVGFVLMDAPESNSYGCMVARKHYDMSLDELIWTVAVQKFSAQGLATIFFDDEPDYLIFVINDQSLEEMVHTVAHEGAHVWEYFEAGVTHIPYEDHHKSRTWRKWSKAFGLNTQGHLTTVARYGLTERIINQLNQTR